MATTTPSPSNAAPRAREVYNKTLETRKDIDRFGREAKDSLQELHESIETPDQKRRRLAHIEKSLVNLSRRIDNRQLRQEIEAEIHLAAKAGDFRSVGEKMKASPEISENENLQIRVDQLIAQQDQYGMIAGKIRGIQNIRDRLPAWAMAGAGAGVAAMTFDEVLDKYYVQENGRYRAKTQTELAWEAFDEADGIFGKAIAFVKGLVTGGMTRRHTKAAEQAVNTGADAREKVDELKAEYGDEWEKVVEVGHEAGETAREANATRAEVMADLRANPEAYAAYRRSREVAAIKSKEFISRKNKKIGEAIDGVAGKVVQNGNFRGAMEKVVGSAEEVVRDIRKLSPLEQAAVHKDIANKKLKGFQAKTVGKYAVISVLSQGFSEALRAKDPKAFLDNISNSNIWVESLIPGVGSYKSITRLFKDNGDSMGMKMADLGINVAADVWSVTAIAAGCIFGFGAGCVAGAAASQAGRTAIAGAAKFLTRAGLKGTARATARTGSKYLAKAGAKETVETGTKLAAGAAGKEASKSALKKGSEWIGDTLWTSGKYAGTMLAVESAWQEFFPAEKVKEMTIQIGLDHLNQQIDPYVSPGLRDLYATISGDEFPLGSVPESL